MKEILFATGNPSKAKRFSKGLEEKGIKVITLQDTDIAVDVEETGKNAVENALIKARAFAECIDIPVLAMDDNLYLDGVPDEKQPGTFVRRVNGKRLSDDEMIKHYTNLVKEFGKDGKINSRWIYGIAVINRGKESTYTWSKASFYIVDQPSPIINPGYPLNSISVHQTLNKYFSEFTEEDRAKTLENEQDVVDFIANCVLPPEKDKE